MTATLTTLLSFNGTNGRYPYGGLIIDANGDLFGTTTIGGAYGVGTVFEIAKTSTGYASTPSTLVSFNGSDGTGPYGDLIMDANGDLLGTTSAGGVYGVGTVFEIAKTSTGYASAPNTLISFNSTDGSYPYDGLITDANGDLFGTTYEGGAYGGGTVFEIAKTSTGYASTPITLISFNGTYGSYPYGRLIMDANGDLFGTTYEGGTDGLGTVFEIAKTSTGYVSTPSTLVSFSSTDGRGSTSGLTMDSSGDLFGTTTGGGGAYGLGTVFEIAKTSTGYASRPSTLVNFNDTDGSIPSGYLIMDANGDLLGTTLHGGVYGYGTVFEIAKTSTGYASAPNTLISFDGTDGSYPYDGLIRDANGDLFGTTYSGGAYGYGTVFGITAQALFSASSDMVDFNNLTSDQIAAINAGADLYNTLDGNDIVHLPSVASAADLSGTGVSYDLGDFLSLGDGNDIVYGSPDGPTNVVLGTGADAIFIGDGGGTIVVPNTVNATVDDSGSTSTVEVPGSFAQSGKISFIGAGQNILSLGAPTLFSGSVTGLKPGDQIILSNTSFSIGNGVLAATIGKNANNVQALAITEQSATNVEANTTDPRVATTFTIQIEGPANATDLTTDYFKVTASGANTILTLESGGPPIAVTDDPTTTAIPLNNPLKIAVNGLNVAGTGAGVTIGVISGWKDGYDEGLAMEQVIHDIAPDAEVIVESFPNLDAVSEQDLADQIARLKADGCQIIVDDLYAKSGSEGDVVDRAINAAVSAGVTYVTAAQNFGDPDLTAGFPTPTPIFGHSAFPDALTVAAINILAIPNSALGGYISPTQAEPFSSAGAAGSNKPDITGPDGGPNSVAPLLSSESGLGLDPFFGTSAAAPAVAAVAALMMQANPLLENLPLTVRKILMNTADPIAGASPNQVGSGLVDAYRAVTQAESFVPANATPMIPGALVTISGGAVTVALQTGQTVGLDALFSFYGGTIPTLIIDGPGTAVVTGKAEASVLEVTSGASLTLQDGSVVTDPVTIDAAANLSGYGTITGDETVNGTITASSGSLVITGDVNGSGSLIVGTEGSLELDGTVAASNKVNFASGARTLILGQSAQIIASLSGFGPGDSIAVKGQHVAAVVYDANTNRLALTGSSGTTFSLSLVGTYEEGNFAVVSGDVAFSAPPVISRANPSVVEKDQTTVIGTAVPGLIGDTLMLKETEGAGTLTLGPLLPNGTQEVIYTAPASVPASSIDAVSYTITENGITVVGAASVQLDAGPTLTPVAPSQVAQGQTVTVATLVQGLPTDTLAVVGGPTGLVLLSRSLQYTEFNRIAAGSTDKFTFAVKDQLGGSTITETVILGSNGDYTLSGAAGGYSVISLGTGNHTLSLYGSHNAVTLGNSTTTEVTLNGGSSNTISLGSGNTTVQGGSHDTITVNGTNLLLAGLGETVFLGPKSAVVEDDGSGLTIKIGPTSGADTLYKFTSDPSAIVDLTGGIGGFNNVSAVLNALKSDGQGGSILKFGPGSSLDFAGILPNQLHAASFKIE